MICHMNIGCDYANVVLAVLTLAAVLVFAGCNKQMVDLTYSYEYAIIGLPNGETVEGKVSSWTDFEDGANIPGFHMEGPFISEKYIGAQNPKYIRLSDDAVLEELGNVKLITVAPELSGMASFIPKAAAVGTRVCIGHTDCNYNEAVRAFESGAVCLTHTFNAMPPLHHREPGPIGAAIMSNAYVQVICDGIHIHKAAITALYRIFGSECMVLISDSMRATGIDDGEYMFGGQKVVVRGGVARTEDGALAGSTSTLYSCVMKAIEFGIPADEAFAMASRTPANMMGVKKGRIEAGYDADFIVVDEDYRLLDVLKFV